MDNLYYYKAHVTYIYNGNTIVCDIDCGFGLILTKRKIRLFGIDTPELRSEDYEKGLYVRNILKNKIQGKNVIIQIIKDKQGKYGRYLGIIYLLDDDKYTNINEWLVKNGHAIRYKV